MHGRGEQIHSHTPLSLRHRVCGTCRPRALTWRRICMGGVCASRILLSLWSLIANVEQLPDRHGSGWVKNPVKTSYLRARFMGRTMYVHFVFHVRLSYVSLKDALFHVHDTEAIQTIAIEDQDIRTKDSERHQAEPLDDSKRSVTGTSARFRPLLRRLSLGR